MARINFESIHAGGWAGAFKLSKLVRVGVVLLISTDQRRRGTAAGRPSSKTWIHIGRSRLVRERVTKKTGLLRRCKTPERCREGIAFKLSKLCLDSFRLLEE